MPLGHSLCYLEKEGFEQTHPLSPVHLKTCLYLFYSITDWGSDYYCLEFWLHDHPEYNFKYMFQEDQKLY